MRCGEQEPSPPYRLCQNCYGGLATLPSSILPGTGVAIANQTTPSSLQPSAPSTQAAVASPVPVTRLLCHCQLWFQPLTLTTRVGPVPSPLGSGLCRQHDTGRVPSGCRGLRATGERAGGSQGRHSMGPRASSQWPGGHQCPEWRLRGSIPVCRVCCGGRGEGLHASESPSPNLGCRGIWVEYRVSRLLVNAGFSLFPSWAGARALRKWLIGSPHSCLLP